MGRKNRRKKSEYRDRLGFNPQKYICPGVPGSRKHLPQRGDIWYAELYSHSGTCVQRGCCPVVVLSNDIGNVYAETLNVLPMTRHLKKPNLPCHIELDPDCVSDRRQVMDVSMILAEQITTIDKSELRGYVGHIQDDAVLSSVNHTVSVQLGLEGADKYCYERGAVI